MLTESTILDVLRQVQDPEIHRDIVSLEMVKDIHVDGTRVALKVDLTTPACPLKDQIGEDIRTRLVGIGATDVELTWGASVRRAAPSQPDNLVPGVKNIIAVASGKGGVGKSSVSVNLATALAMEGASVGLLDADITGPNIPQMMGLEGAPTAAPSGKILPLERYGVKVISIQFFVPEGQPIVWRGPLVGGADPAVPAGRRVGRARLPRGGHAAGHLRRPAHAGAVGAGQRRAPGDDAPGCGARQTWRRPSRCSGASPCPSWAWWRT